VVKPTPKPVVKKTPPKPKEITKPTPKPTRESPPKIKIASLDNLITASDSSAEKKRREAEERRQREAAKRAELEQKRQLAKLDSLLGDVKFSKGVNVRTSGSSTRATMDYASYVVQTYDREWREPVQMAGSRYTAEVTVTIRSNGSVASVRISRRSGVGALDNSIQEVIDRVRRFRPFPAGMDDSQQTFTIDFSVRAK
jgi:protein TonB